jgi:hypothetical protein
VSESEKTIEQIASSTFLLSNSTPLLHAPVQSFKRQHSKQQTQGARSNTQTEGRVNLAMNYRVREQV